MDMFKYKDTKINLILGDICEFEGDALVNAANNTLLGGGGVDGAIHKKGGKLILEQCKKIGGCPTGEARITTGGNLKCKYVIHTVGPVYRGRYIDKNLLYKAYYNSLILSLDYNIKTLGFPSISTGAYGYPIEEAVEIALNAVINFLDINKGFDEINFILHNKKDFQVYSDHLGTRIDIL